MKTLFITTGTSALTAQKLWDHLGKTERNSRKELIESYERRRKDRDAQEEFEQDNGLFDTVLKAHRHWWNSWGLKSDRLTTSAEMSSTSLLLCDTKLLAPWEADDRLVLLLSDTAAGNLAGRLNGQLMHDFLCVCKCGADFQTDQRRCSRVVLHTIPKLDAATGFEPVTQDLKRLTEHWNRPAAKLSFNITGGYKGAIPSITCVASRAAWPLYYLHETQAAIVKVNFAGGADYPDEEFLPVDDEFFPPDVA